MEERGGPGRRTQGDEGEAEEKGKREHRRQKVLLVGSGRRKEVRNGRHVFGLPLPRAGGATGCCRCPVTARGLRLVFSAGSGWWVVGCSRSPRIL